MAILNYTTTVPVDKTIGEIQKLLIKNGASKIVFDYADGLPVSLTFVAVFKGETAFYSLPSRFEGIYKLLKNQSRVPKTMEQAHKIGWRILKDWIESQLALIEAEIAELPEIFLPYGVTRNGERLYDYIKSLDSNNSPLLLS